MKRVYGNNCLLCIRIFRRFDERFKDNGKCEGRATSALGCSKTDFKSEDLEKVRQISNQLECANRQKNVLTDKFTSIRNIRNIHVVNVKREREDDTLNRF